MIYRLKLLLVFFMINFLVSCSMLPKEIQPEKKVSIKEEVVQGIKISYILPKDAKDSPYSIHGLNFVSGKGLNSTVLSPFKLEVQRINAYSTNSSKVVYQIDITSFQKDNLTLVLTPNLKRIYEGDLGLGLKVPVPELDIKNYLASVSLDFDFEVDSEYPPQAIEANFSRLLSKKNIRENEYWFNENDIKVNMKIKVFAYRNGSKTQVHLRLGNQKIRDTIDFASEVEKMKTQVKEIIKS